MANYTQAPWVEGNKTTYSEFKADDAAFQKKSTLYDGFQELKNAFTTMIAAAKKDGGSFREIFSGNKDAGKQDNTTQGATTFMAPKGWKGGKTPNLGNQKALEQLFIKKPTASDDMDLSFANSLKINSNKYDDLIESKYGFKYDQ